MCDWRSCDLNVLNFKEFASIMIPTNAFINAFFYDIPTIIECATYTNKRSRRIGLNRERDNILWQLY